MPECELPCEWIVVWTDSDLTIKQEDVVYYTDSIHIITRIFGLMLTNPDIVTYNIEEDGEVMEFTYQLYEDEPQIFTLYRRKMMEMD